MITLLIIIFYYTMIILYERDGDTQRESEDDF